MPITRELPAALLVVAGVAIGSAGTAWADESRQGAVAELNGTYGYQSDTGRLSTWTITPCGAGCADVAVTPVTDPRIIPYGGQARLEDGQWYMPVLLTQTVRCKAPNDDATVPGTVEFLFDASTLSGTALNTQAVDGCGDPAGASYEGTFTLTKIA